MHNSLLHSIEPLAGTPNFSPLATLDSDRAASRQEAQVDTSSSELIGAQGWIITTDGKIMLVASAPEATPSTRPTASVCPASK